MSMHLNEIKTPADLKRLTDAQRIELCEEIRETMIQTVSKNGGHLASNLGIVELTVALHSVFNTPDDTVIFDVGHQCYVHKLLTGRYSSFDSLRKKDGISGFPKPQESIYDSFIEGHASTSISQAIGIAHAKALKGDNSKTIAIIGDGSLTGGLAFEAMNNLDPSLTNLIVILNDNSMSISKSVGTLSNYLMKLRTSSNYIKIKNKIRVAVDEIPIVGSKLTNFITTSKTALRRQLFGGTLFEELGFNYIGPIDGHDLKEIEFFLNHVKDFSSDSGPVFLHVITKKGKGYTPAEKNPGAYHGVGHFSIDKGNPDISLVDSFSNTFGRTLADISNRDNNICAVTAAMKYATGLQYFAHLHPERFFDVGIAEQHAVTMCAGLSKGNMKPVFAVYSTFLQRATDQLIHDISLDDIDILLAIDRAGLVGDDGETHQGIYDVSILNSIGVYTIVSPSNYSELTYWLPRLLQMKGAKAIRYPRGKEDPYISNYNCTGNEYDLITQTDSKILLITYGREYAEVLKAQSLLSKKGISTDILKLNVIAPLSEAVSDIVMRYNFAFFFEEGIRSGGVGENLSLKLFSKSYSGRYLVKAIDCNIVKQASVLEQLTEFGLDSTSIIDFVKDITVEKKN